MSFCIVIIFIAAIRLGASATVNKCRARVAVAAVPGAFGVAPLRALPTPCRVQPVLLPAQVGKEVMYCYF